MQAVLDRHVKLGREFQLIGGVELRFEFDGLDGRSPEPKRIRSHAVLAALYGLDLEGPCERVGVVLQDDHALDHAAIGVDQDDAALQQSRGAGEIAHDGDRSQFRGTGHLALGAALRVCLGDLVLAALVAGVLIVHVVACRLALLSLGGRLLGFLVVGLLFLGCRG